MYTRNQTRVISIGDVKIGGGNPVAIQSMTNTKTENVEETVKQILALEGWMPDHSLYCSNNESCRSFYRD